MSKSSVRIKKLVDTVPTFGAAEYHLLKEDFSRFLRGKYSTREIASVDIDRIIKTYNLKGIVFGNYLTQEERFFYLFKISKQLEALAKIGGGDNLGKGELTIAFGSEGKAQFLAHYSPRKKLINLNRGRRSNYAGDFSGENSFIHEFAHFIDFRSGRNDLAIKTNACSNHLLKTGDKVKPITRTITQLTDKVQRQRDYMIGLSKYSNSRYLTKRIELYARIMESALTYYIADTDKSLAKFLDIGVYKSNIYLEKASIYKSNLQGDCLRSLKQFVQLK